MSLVNTTFLALAAVFLLTAIRQRWRRRGLPLPPGPKGLPLIGSLLRMSKPKTQPDWLTYLDWSRIYRDGDKKPEVVYFKVLGSGTIILNSYKAALELLEKRSGNYSDRPDFYMLNGLLGMTWNFGFMRYSNQWRLHRKTFHQYFHPRVVSEYYPSQRAAAQTLVQDLLESPKDFYHHVEHFAGSTVLDIAYGYKLQKKNDPYIKIVHESSKGIDETVPASSFLIEYLPLLRYIPEWMPGTSFKTRAKPWAKASNDMIEYPWKRVKQAWTSGTAAPCYSTRSLEKFQVPLTSDSKEVSGIEEVTRNCAAAAYQAGAHTTVSAILSFILAMTLHPEVQKAAQEEIDRVVGRERMPDFSDKESLPFVDAVLSEILRWNPVAPLGVPHRSMEDDVYKGYFIPGDSTVVPNVWAMLHSEELYGPNHMKFDPWRFMKPQDAPLPDPVTIAFGFGRRMCPGRHVAVNSLWSAMVHLLKRFTIEKDVDENGNVIEVEQRYTDALVSSPEPFKCRFTPREV